MSETIEKHDALHGERPPTPIIIGSKGPMKTMMSEPVRYHRGEVSVLARWTTTNDEPPISGWFPEGGENPIPYWKGDWWEPAPATSDRT